MKYFSSGCFISLKGLNCYNLIVGGLRVTSSYVIYLSHYLGHCRPPDAVSLQSTVVLAPVPAGVLLR